jgi:predicted dinucleotide-binding enzyme
MMNIGILGTGMVGNALGTKLVQSGDLVTMGSRTAHRTAASRELRHSTFSLA